MRKRSFIAITLLISLSQSFLWANDDEVANGVITEVENDSAANRQREILQKFTEENAEVRDKLAACKDRDSDGNGTIATTEDTNITVDLSIYECTWKGLEDETQFQIQDALSAGEGDKEKKYTQIKLGNFDKETNKAFGSLQEHLKKKMNQVIYGDNTEGVKGLSDHTVFYDLYRSQVGKNMLYTVSQYCLFADPKGKLEDGVTDSALYTRIKNKRTNLELLKVLSTEGRSSAFEGFNNCIANISNGCTLGNYPLAKEAYQRQFDRIKGALNLDDQSEEYKADKLAAKEVPTICEVNRYMTAARHTLSDVKELQEQIDLSQQDNPNGSYQNIVQRRMKDQIDFNEVVNIGSKEFLESNDQLLDESSGGESYNSSVEAEATTLRDTCATQGEGVAECESYLTNKEDNEKIKDEFNFRNIAMKSKIDDLTTEQLREYLKEDGMSDEEAEEYIAYQVSKGNDEGQILQQIKDQYSNEITALQNSLQERLKSTQRKTAEELQANPNQGDGDTYTDIANRMSANATNYAHVIHYTNIVSSFLEVDTGSGSKTRNTQALAVELDSNFFESDNRAPAASGGNFDELTGVVENSDPESDDSNINMPKTISSDDILEIQYRSSDPPATN